VTNELKFLFEKSHFCNFNIVLYFKYTRRKHSTSNSKRDTLVDRRSKLPIMTVDPVICISSDFFILCFTVVSPPSVCTKRTSLSKIGESVSVVKSGSFARLGKMRSLHYCS